VGGLVVAGAGWTKSLHGLIADVLPSYAEV